MVGLSRGFESDEEKGFLPKGFAFAFAFAVAVAFIMVVVTTSAGIGLAPKTEALVVPNPKDGILALVVCPKRGEVFDIDIDVVVVFGGGGGGNGSVDFTVAVAVAVAIVGFAVASLEVS